MLRRRPQGIIGSCRFGLSYRNVWHITSRLCNAGNTGSPQTATGASAETAIGGRMDDTRAHQWNDTTLLNDIARILCQLLSQRGTAKQDKSEGSQETKSLHVHELFRELGVELRYQLQNSSFGLLDRALQSKPEWFVLSANGSAVSCTEAMRLHLEGIGREGFTDTIPGAANVPNLECKARSVRCSKPAGHLISCKTNVLVHGPLATTPVDVSKPPITPEEIEQLKLRRLICPLNLYFLLDGPPVTLFPSGDKPRRLSDQFQELDALYVAKGFFSPSEVAAAFIHITPTFFVETRHVLNAMSPDVAHSFERHMSRDHIVDAFFKKYPMIFKLKTGKFQKASVKLNLDFPFVRDYPGCGRADRPLRRYNQEYRATVGGLSARPLPSAEPAANARRGEPHIDVKIFEVLVRNLPRVPTDPTIPKQQLEEQRCQSFPLVEWINKFSQDDIETLNSVPQARVLTLMTRYVRIFQLMCHGEDGNVFTESKCLDQLRNGRRSLPEERSNASRAASDSTKLDEDLQGEVVDFGVDDIEDEDGKTPDTALIASKEEVKRREANLSAALRDDLIGLDEILLEGKCPSVEPVEKDGVTSGQDNGDSASLKNPEDGDDEVDGFEGGSNCAEGDDVFLPCGEGNEETEFRRSRNVDSSFPNEEEGQSGFYIPSRYDIIYVRRLPKHIAPRSLSDYNVATTPEPELLQYLVAFLNPPPSLHGNLMMKKVPPPLKFAEGKPPMPWRWVPVQRIYASLSKEQKRLLRPYKGLVHFMRLHGEVFELSDDLLHVIAHDPQGKIPPFVPTQTVFNSEDRVLLPPTLDDDENSKASLIGDTERNKFRSILGASQIPTDRRQLLLLDPQNPLLDHEVLCEEVSFFMPDHPVSLHQLVARLPPILKAALSHRHRNNFKSSKHLTVWSDGTRMMLQKSKLGVPEAALQAEEGLSVEDAVECIREVVPDEGIMVGHLQRMLPSAAKRTLKEQFGGLHTALLGYPQYFYIEKNGEDRNSSMLFLVERLQHE
ncbi:hypothetical protein, conserved [Trypanosoma brucei brucei TREU927]|uniref:Uncharacterized protein n=1 Tax=Trypanosoma brucei brucei (strain 927/4 GUTat10.1) TaxID=185431 RepID=Q584C9_TRYB2|nr:hypothetical protein, conserved [Trypanosoma brucei brucei TREU927]AAX79076.1 hypothetical protein, conserved [Trypanosoma brucei]AAZ10849.1 hypothetical protein, conserved [Trypanosoma brucei brucei TREU927]